MTQQNTPVIEQPAAPVPSASPAAPPSTQPSGGPSGKKKKKKRSVVKTVIALVVTAAIIFGIGFGMYNLVFKEDDTLGEAMTDFVMRSSIQSMVEGYGLTKAKDAATITPGTGTILELYVQEGDLIEAGVPLYRMDDSAAREAVTNAQKDVDNASKQLQSIYDAAKDLTITAPHAGKLLEVGEFKQGDTVGSGTEIATLVNDTKLRLSLYYNYTYENDIYVGQPVNVSIPAIMGEQSGKVEAINKVRFISPEGGVYFEVVVVINNPGTLTEGMDASAAITAGDGSAVYPYENGQLKYYETTRITAKTQGPVEQVNLLRYGDVKAGALLMQLGAEDNEAEIASAESALKAAQEKLETAVKELEKYNAVAPIAGTVLSCNLTEGEEVQSGQGITIADTSTMTIDINVDELNISNVKVGMMVNIDYQGQPFMGIVESVSLTGTAENGMSTFPAVVSVDNPDGIIMSNSYANYSFVASQSENCLTVPVNAVKYVSFLNVPGIEDLIAAGPVDDGMGNMDDMGGFTDGMDGSMTDGDGEPALPDGDGVALPEDGAVLPEGGIDVPEAGGEAVPIPQNYSGGAFAEPLGMMVSGGGVVVVPGGSMSAPMTGSSGGSAGSSGGSAISEDGTGYIVFVRAPEAPANAILEPDPAWECPEGFWAVPVVTGLSNTTQVEIVSGLNEGDEVFIGYATNSGSSWG